MGGRDTGKLTVEGKIDGNAAESQAMISVLIPQPKRPKHLRKFDRELEQVLRKKYPAAAKKNRGWQQLVQPILETAGMIIVLVVVLVLVVKKRDINLSFNAMGIAQPQTTGDKTAAVIGMAGELKTLFQKHNTLQGDDLIFYLDVSGNMEKNAGVISHLVTMHLPKTKIVELHDNRIHPRTGIVKAMENDRSSRKKVFYLSDLRNSVTDQGVRQLRAQFLNQQRRELHIISFDREPHSGLGNIARRSNGSITHLFAGD